jgi:hypothetical protein
MERTKGLTDGRKKGMEGRKGRTDERKEGMKEGRTDGRKD